ncbi:universal stress protein [Photobacterium halotolerans]|uniref:universal stress protein n=1 Tax=Photobacterium halotolerans TaxID=265726 RepID=UPI0003FCF35A|nr:universal stress protein [Photobacterium halotolerans]
MKRFNSILCVIDSEHTFDTAVSQSIRIASDHQADITFVSVIGTVGFWRSTLHPEEDHHKFLDEQMESQRATIASRLSVMALTVKPNIEVYSGIGFIEIIKSVLKNQHDLVVKCAEESDWLSRIFGSEDMHLLRKCPCPVLILKPGQDDRFRNILATVSVNDSFSELDKGRVQEALNRQVLEYSVTLCLPELTQLHVGSAWDAYAENFYRYGAFTHLPEKDVDQYTEQVRRKCSDKLDILVREMNDMLGKDAIKYLLPRIHLVKGKPSREIPLMTDKYGIDLIVMGTVGRVGIPGLIIGNTAESILEQVKCSVLAIKPEGFKTPVV